MTLSTHRTDARYATGIPSIVYSQILKKLYPDVPIILGGIEASMRRLSHYDYWQDQLKKASFVKAVPTC